MKENNKFFGDILRKITSTYKAVHISHVNNCGKYIMYRLTNSYSCFINI